ncbi:photoreceptor disk component PRCD isoform X1 [Saimiri boliviensis]|uniref:photoreceptor disk component PRCD isoform X1 n=1 Tax=Saimiri boliviensis TaxID=27679 RepID=UPI003D77CB55
MGVPGGIGGHAALGGAGRPGVRRGGRGPGALGPGSQSVRHRGCARADPSRGGKLTQSPTLRRFRESPATWMGQLGPAAWTQTLRPQAGRKNLGSKASPLQVGSGPETGISWPSSSPGSSPSPGGCCGSRGSSKRDNGEKQH